MPPPPMLQPYDPTRGLISCFDHAGDKISDATAWSLLDLLVDHHEEAFRRLPVDDVPLDVDLAKLVDQGGLCLGLLDPVTNIVLNTVSLLPNGFETNPSTPPATSGSSSLTAPSSRRHGERSRESWRDVAWRSTLGLLEFMRAYFGLLTQEQAGRYLVWARADLALAVLLVEHELYAARPALPDPSSGRTRNSFRLAAKHVNHPWPDHLASLATTWLPRERFEMLAPVLRHEAYRNTFTVDDVRTILQVFRHQDDISAMTTIPPSPTLEEGVETEVKSTTSCDDLGDGRISYTTVTVTLTVVQRIGDHIASLRRSQDMDSTLSSYSTAHAAPPVPGTTTKWPPQQSPCASVRSLDADASSCPYLRSLEMSLYGTIHGFYLRALAMLPSHAPRHHVRGVLLGGHCYGPMDPVSNILLSAVWYDATFPLPDADRPTQAHDILDPLAILRAVSRSLHGLIALVHATSGQQLPLHEILKHLCYAQCDISGLLQPHLQKDQSSPNPLAAATAAAQHPQASYLAAFFASLAPTKLDRLRSLMLSATANNSPLSQDCLSQIHNILTKETLTTAIPWRLRPPRLCNTALSILTSKRQSYDHQVSIVRGNIELLLQEYARGHPSEPKYDLHFICGVAVTPGQHFVNQRYHINFMAATETTIRRNKLFFAEFWGATSYHSLSKQTAMCCPLEQPYDMGRCYYGRESARKIVYPDHFVHYFTNDITHGGLDATELTLDTDFLYFDSERDVGLAKDLQRMAKQQEVMQRSSTGMTSQWRIHAPC